MKARTALLALLVAACSRVTADNFEKIQEGMSEPEVRALLGTPTESNSVTVLGVSGTASRWRSRDAEIVVRFINGKVALKTFEKMR
jgi:hypothetical protein